jgi:ubiquitin-protein ligase
MSSNAIKRIMNKDIKSIYNKNLNELGIHIHFNDDDMLKANAMVIGPKDTIYENGILFFNILFPKNYPYCPPKITYINDNKIRIHPNIYVNGKICLSILGTWSGPSWSSIYDITDVFIIIQSLLDNNPINHEPGYENNSKPLVKKISQSYNKIIKYNTINSLILNRYNNINTLNDTNFHIFKDIIIKHISDNKNDIIKSINDNINYKDKISIGLYNINININYNHLIEKCNNIIK